MWRHQRILATKKPGTAGISKIFTYAVSIPRETSEKSLNWTWLIRASGEGDITVAGQR